MDFETNNNLDFFKTLDTKCSRAIKRSFCKNETITTYIENRN